MYLPRKIDTYLEEYNFKKPLLIIGTRQCGKSTSINKFANKFKRCIKVNFLFDLEVKQYFENSSTDYKSVVTFLEIYSNTKIDKDTLIFFDEIQICNKALNSLKSFKESNQNYNIIASGSLLGIKINIEDTFPVGCVVTKHMYPLDFEEFLIAMNHKNLVDVIYESIESLKIESHFHQLLLKKFDEFINVGGMPESVKMFINNESLYSIKTYLNEINTNYKLDINKFIDDKNSLITSKVYDSIESQLGKDNQKFIKKHVPNSKRADDYQTAIDWLVASNNVCKVTNVSSPIHPLKVNKNDKNFKLFLFDVAVLIARSNYITQTMDYKDRIFTGIISENYVANELQKAGFDLYYYDDNKKEIDFLINFDDKIIPIEVKASYNTKSKSLKAYLNQYNDSIAIRVSKKEFGYSNNIISLPLYAVFALGKVPATKW